MKKKIVSLAMVAAFGAMTMGPVMAGAVDVSKVPAKKQTTLNLYLSPAEAYEMKKTGGDKVLLIDVRTPEEIQYLGSMALMDANIPYQFNDISDFDAKKKVYASSLNSNFTVAVGELVAKQGLSKDSPIILSCRSGDRSAVAANLLVKAGYTKVYSAVEGFEGDMSKEGRRAVNGWKNADLPWTYTMDKSKMYFVLN